GDDSVIFEIERRGLEQKGRSPEIKESSVADYGKRRMRLEEDDDDVAGYATCRLLVGSQPLNQRTVSAHACWAKTTSF
ncbi:hypothetical protein LINGRAHAP2_LOCUS31337, partial [Linum grandiflorum]